MSNGLSHLKVSPLFCFHLCHSIPKAMAWYHYHLSSGSCHHLLAALPVFFLAWLQFIPYITSKERFKNMYEILSFAHLDFSYSFHLYLKYKLPTRAPNPCLPPSSYHLPPKVFQLHWSFILLEYTKPNLSLGFYAYCLCLESSASSIFFMAGFFWIFRAQHKCY